MTQKTKTKRILVVDDDADVRVSVSFLLSNHQYQVIEADSPGKAFDIIKEQFIDLILLDMNYSTDTTSGREGLDFIDRMQKEELSIPIIAMTGWSSVELAVKAMQQGVGDFIEKPWDNQRLLQVVKQQLQLASLIKSNQALRQQHANQQQQSLICRSPSMKSLMDAASRLAQTDATILLTGENGTGKSSIAKMIHEQSNRSSQNLVTVNMGAIPEFLFESEMFGHKKGAFTDAKETRIGRFEVANEGTLFLDEIANIPPSLQAKLLRVLETREFEMVGSSITLKVDARLISASNADFDKLIAEGRFRPDLFYRLNTIELRVPPLRERIDDLLPLAEHFLHKHGTRYGKAGLSLADDVEEKLKSYHWPGNVRELSHMLERAVLLASNQQIAASDFLLRPNSQANTDEIQSLESFSSEIPTLDQAELQL